MIKMRKPLSFLLSVIVFLAVVPFCSIGVAAEDAVFVSDVPESEGVRNALLNAEQLANLTFMPLKSVPQKAGDLSPGKEQKGLPYSSSRIEEGFVPNFVSLYTFMSALKNPNSYLYTVDLGELGNQNGDTYYGTVCSTFCTYALNVMPNYTTHQWQDIPGMITLPHQTVNALKLGDTICHKTSGHVVMVVGVTRNSLGQVGEVTIAEAATTKAMVRKPYTAEEFQKKYPTDVYAYHRYTKIDEVEHISLETSEYNTELIPRKGDKANWLAGVPVEIDLLAKNRYTSVEVYKDDALYERQPIGGREEIPVDRTLYGLQWKMGSIAAASSQKFIHETHIIPITNIMMDISDGSEVRFVWYDGVTLDKNIGISDFYTGAVTLDGIAPATAKFCKIEARYADERDVLDANALAATVAIKISEDAAAITIPLAYGGLLSSTGVEIDNYARCRSGFLPIQNLRIDGSENVKYYVYYYDENKNYLISSGQWLSGPTYIMDGKPANAAYFRLVVKNTLSDAGTSVSKTYYTYAQDVPATIIGGVLEGGMDVLTLNNLEAGSYKARMTNGTDCSDWCYWIVVDAECSAEATENCREARVTFSASNANPLFVKWSGGKDNGAKHISVLDEEQIAAGAAVCKYETSSSDGQSNQYKIRVAFQTEYGVIHTALEDVTTVVAHTYDGSTDYRCNTCGTFRLSNLPVIFGGNSVSEDVSGLAFRFDVTTSGLKIKEGTRFQADYTEAYTAGSKLISMGAIADNGASTIDIPCVYLCSCEEEMVSFAVRIIDIPQDKYDTPITVTPYQVLEIDGEEVIRYGKAQTASYNGVIQ